MSCFQFSTNPIELLFYGLSLLQLMRGVQIAQIVWREWGEFRQEPLTRRKAWLGEQAAFFLAIPPSVAVHEFFHAIPIWAFGGRVVRCGYGFYWGFVQADRLFLSEEQWLISLAGTIGSLLFGLTLWWLLRRHQSSAVRFFALRSLRTQLFYALIFYPAFSALTFIGDWRVIYNFEQTPMLSGLVLVLHGVALGAVWYAQKQGWFEMRQADSAAEVAQIRQAEAAAKQTPHNLPIRLQYIRALRQAGTISQARREAEQFCREFPQAGEGYIELALLQTNSVGQLPRSALDHVRHALSLPISHPDYLVTAHLVLGHHAIQVEKFDEAVDRLSYALELSEAIPGEAQGKLLGLAQAYYLRAMAQHRLGQKGMALTDIDKAIEMARRCGRDAMLKSYQNFKLSLTSNP